MTFGHHFYSKAAVTVKMAFEGAVGLALQKGMVTPDFNTKSKYGTGHVLEFIANTIVDNDELIRINTEIIVLVKSTMI